MRFDELVERFKKQDPNDAIFNFMLNQVADYTMNEQTIIKKDNKTNDVDTIKYRYDENTYRYINEFFSKIKFLSTPKIGGGKKPIIKDLPQEKKYSSNHEMPLEDKIYILDKIKDSFMHLEGDTTLYVFDCKSCKIIIKNAPQNTDYSLECEISIEDLFKFNKQLKTEDCKDVTIVNGEVIFTEKGKPKVTSDKTRLEDLYSYHADSYVTLLMAQKKDKNYPLLPELYNFDLLMKNPSFLEQINGVIKRMDVLCLDLLELLNNREAAKNEKAKSRINEKIIEKIELFLFDHDQTGEEIGLISDMSKINSAIIEKMRNARSHANIKSNYIELPGEEDIIFYDVSYNSLINQHSEKADPKFAIHGKKKDFDNLFKKMKTTSMSNEALYNMINYELKGNGTEVISESETLNLFLDQIDKFIIQATIMGNTYAETLLTPIGNATGLTDCIKKAIYGGLEKGDVSQYDKTPKK